ncbi:MAG: IS3 family transposase [Eubacteriales bacterium]|nr:IS3 family transposase [Eubacteriales bacterium]
MHEKHKEETRTAIIDRYLSGISVKELSHQQGVPRSTIYHWIQKHNEQINSAKKKKVNLQNFKLLENKVTRLKGIIQIIKTAGCAMDAPLQEKLNAIEKLRESYSVHMLCEAYDIPRGTFYNHIFRSKRDNVWYVKHREDLRLKIQKVYEDSKQIFGAGKICAVLRSQGERVSQEMVLEIMRDMGIASIRQTSKKTHDKEERKFKNHLKQDFVATQPQQKWVSDVTVFKYKDNWIYICVIIDLFSRMVIAHKIGYSNSTQLVKSTLVKAYDKRKPQAGLVFHTDRGSNYRSKAIYDYMQKKEIIHSFSRAYVPYDNSVVESFFASMKREELYRTKYRSEKELRTAVDTYINWFNTKRPHAKLHYKTPLAKETEFYSNQSDLQPE